jgi:hypothetical protein
VVEVDFRYRLSKSRWGIGSVGALLDSAARLGKQTTAAAINPRREYVSRVILKDKKVVWQFRDILKVSSQR